MNKCIDQSVFPSDEKIAEVTTVYKNGAKTNMENYCLISVLNSFSKLFKLLIHEQIYEYLEGNDLLNVQQFGFRKSRSTQHAVSLFIDNIRRNIDIGNLTGATFVDLSKAFETIDHGCILSKLQCYGIKNRELH